MMRTLTRQQFLPVIIALILSTTACAPEIGSEKWCATMKEKPKGEWTANEAGDFAKHCLF